MKNDTVKNSRSWLQYVVLAIVLFLCFILQSTPMNLFGIQGIRPVFLVMLTLCSGLVYGELVGGTIGFCAGMLMDLYVTPSVSFHTFVLTFLGIACGLAIGHLFMDNALSALVLCFVGSFVYFSLYWLLFRVILSDGGAWVYYYRFSLPSAVYTGVLGLVFYPLLRWIRSMA
jgi:rod shape-determining protein MreD